MPDGTIEVAHLTDDDIIALSSDIITAENASALDHLARCEQCSSALAAMRNQFAEPIDVPSFAQVVHRLLPVFAAADNSDECPWPGEPAGQPAVALAHADSSFTTKQMRMDEPRKEQVGRWAVTHPDLVPVSSNSVVYFDAGSTAFFAYTALKTRVMAGELCNINIVTSSYAILEDFNHKEMFELVGRGITLELIGDIYDPVNSAFRGPALRRKIQSGEVRPAVIFIGTAGMQLQQEHIWFACQGREPEKDAKRELFEWDTGTRVILSTAAKIGKCSGSAFDLLRTPIAKGRTLLLTTEPDHTERPAYEQAKSIFTASLEHELTKKGVDFRWIEIREDGTHTQHTNYDPARLFSDQAATIANRHR